METMELMSMGHGGGQTILTAAAKKQGLEALVLEQVGRRASRSRSRRGRKSCNPLFSTTEAGWRWSESLSCLTNKARRWRSPMYRSANKRETLFDNFLK